MPPHFYLIHGPDELTAAEFVADLKARQGDPALASLNFAAFDGRSANLADVRGACDALPFLAERRLVVVEGWLTRLLGKGEADEAEGEPAASASARDTLASLKDYLPNLPESTWLVFVEHRSLPPKNAVLQLAQKSDWAEVKFCGQPDERELPDWIRKRARGAGGEFSRQAAQSLAALEHDLRALDQEVSKLLTYVDYARPVEADDVERVAVGGGQANIFALVDAIGERKTQRAARELHALLERDEPLRILAMIVRQFRLLLLAREARGPELPAALRSLPPFVVSKLTSQARGFAPGALEQIYHQLLDYDLAIKTSQFDAAAALDTLVASLTA